MRRKQREAVCYLLSYHDDDRLDPRGGTAATFLHPHLSVGRRAAHSRGSPAQTPIESQKVARRRPVVPPVDRRLQHEQFGNIESFRAGYLSYKYVIGRQLL